MPHTTDDDDRRYRSAEELESARQRDPVVGFGNFLIEQGILSQDQMDQIKAEALQDVNEATDAAEAASQTDSATLYDMVYAP